MAMKKTPQKLSNPFANSDTNKRYYTFEYYCRRKYGGRCVKIPLDAGFTCPNIDGRCGTGGCIYCSPRGSGDSIPSFSDVREQYTAGRAALASKWDVSRTIPYFQAHTNTYAPIEVLRPLFYDALSFDGAVGLDIATRADCLPEDVTSLLAEIAEKTDLTIELGLQSSDDRTAKLIGRGHDFAAFCDGYRRLRSSSQRISICVHIILGLPGESDEMMLRTVRDVAALRPDMVKLHLLHVLADTRLSEMYRSGNYQPLTQSHYVDLVVSSLELLPADTVIARLTGDGMPDTLEAPLWSRRKIAVINDIDKLMFKKNTWQGRLFE